jgi:hypothetical protein
MAMINAGNQRGFAAASEAGFSFFLPFFALSAERGSFRAVDGARLDLTTHTLLQGADP